MRYYGTEYCSDIDDIIVLDEKSKIRKFRKFNKDKEGKINKLTKTKNNFKGGM